MGKLDGKIALITGGARGQGRSHALTLARNGADIVICDIPRDYETMPYVMGTEEQMNETVRLVEELGRRCVAVKADIRDSRQMQDVADRAVAEFGRIDILCANAGVGSYVKVANMTDQQWNETLDTNLTGTFYSIRAVLPQMIRQQYGRIVATASMAGRVGYQNLGHYVASKWGVIGLVKSTALEVAQEGITVNVVCPGTVNTDMVQHETSYRLFRPNLENPTKEDVAAVLQRLHPIPVPWVEPEDVSNAVLFLVSDDARYITGEAIHVAAGLNSNNAC